MTPNKTINLLVEEVGEFDARFIMNVSYQTLYKWRTGERININSSAVMLANVYLMILEDDKYDIEDIKDWVTSTLP